MKKYILIMAVLIQSAIAFGTPNWTVNSSDYEYSLTATIVVEISGNLAGATGDMVGAFVNDECRGVTDAVYNETYDKYVFYITVFSNEYSGEVVTLKYYNKVDDNIYNELVTIEFEDGKNVGSASSPYKLENIQVGIGTNEKLELEVYPNPVSNMLTIKNSTHVDKTTICNIVGKRVYSSVSNSKIIDVSSLQNGVYFIEVSALGKQYITKFIKE